MVVAKLIERQKVVDSICEAADTLDKIEGGTERRKQVDAALAVLARERDLDILEALGYSS